VSAEARLTFRLLVEFSVRASLQGDAHDRGQSMSWSWRPEDLRRAAEAVHRCDPGCAGMFRDGDTGRWSRCDECAHDAARAGFDEGFQCGAIWHRVPIITDEIVRAFVKRLPVGSVREFLVAQSGWGYPRVRA